VGLPYQGINDCVYPNFPLVNEFDIAESELAPGRLLGSFQCIPADAFRNSTTIRQYLIPFVFPQPLGAELPGDPGEAEDEGQPETFTEDEILTGTYLSRVMTNILGSARYRKVGGVPTFTRLLPWTDFHFRHHVAARVDINTVCYRGMEPDSEGPQTAVPTLPPVKSSNLWKYVIATVHFAAPRFYLGDRIEPDSQTGENPPIESERYCTKEVKSGISYVTARPGLFQWEVEAPVTQDTADILFAIPQVESFEDVIVWWLGVPPNAAPYTAIAKCKGKTNDSSLPLHPVPPPTEYPAESLVLHTHNFIDDYFPNGDRCVHIQYIFKHRLVPVGTNNTLIGGWNYLLYPGTAEYRKVLRKGDTTQGLFLESNFYDLFRPEPIP
jgi:hypothetical protein